MKRTLSYISFIFFFFVLSISAWFLIHFLALFGVFVALAYPLVWFLFPKQTICFVCRVQKEGKRCFLCQRIVRKNSGITPASISSAVFSGIVILCFSFISTVLVFGESRILLRLGFTSTPRTTSFSIPTRGQYRLGEIFPMKIELSGIKTPINAVQADLSFEPEKLEIVDISTKNSFATIFVQKEINNRQGHARLTGGLPDPGFFSDRGTFGTVFFRAKNPGIAKTTFLPTSMILANDGKGTNTLKDFSSVSYLILPEKISLNEEREQKNNQLDVSVLWESTSPAQMKLYDENDVKGAETESVTTQNERANYTSILLSFLEQFDHMIITQYQMIFELVLS